MVNDPFAGRYWATGKTYKTLGKTPPQVSSSCAANHGGGVS